MSAIRFGTPCAACRSEYGRSPHSPIAYGGSSRSALPLRPPVARPAVITAAIIAATVGTSSLRIASLHRLGGRLRHGNLRRNRRRRGSLRRDLCAPLLGRDLRDPLREEPVVPL